MIKSIVKYGLAVAVPVIVVLGLWGIFLWKLGLSMYDFRAYVDAITW